MLKCLIESSETSFTSNGFCRRQYKSEGVQVCGLNGFEILCNLKSLCMEI